MKAMRGKSGVNRALREMHDIGQGLYEIIHHTPLTMASALLTNNKDDRIDIAAVKGLLDQIGDEDGAHECIFCGTGFGGHVLPWRFVIVRPTVDALLAAAHAHPRGQLPIMILAVCRACDELPDVKRRVLAKLDADLFHGIRELGQIGEAGHG